MAAKVNVIFNEIEERLKKIPTITFQGIPKVVIYIVVSSTLRSTTASPSNHTLVLDFRFPAGPKITKTCVSVDNKIIFDKVKERIIIKFEGEDTFTGILKENTNLRKLVEMGAVDICGEKQLLIKIAPLLGSLFSATGSNLNQNQHESSINGKQSREKYIFISDVLRRSQKVYYCLTVDPKVSSHFGKLKINIQKRYSDFFWLDKELRRIGVQHLPKLPKKSISIFQESHKFIEHRRLALEKYINLLIALPAATESVYHFLEIHSSKYRATRSRRDGINRIQAPPNDGPHLPTLNSDLDDFDSLDADITGIQNDMKRHQNSIMSLEFGSAFIHAKILQWVGPAIIDTSFWAGFAYIGYKTILDLANVRLRANVRDVPLRIVGYRIVRNVILMVTSYFLRWRVVTLPNSNVYKRQSKFMYVALCILLGYKIARRMAHGMSQDEKDSFYLYINRRFAILAYLCMSELGGMMVKAGQYMGARSDVTPQVFVDSLSKLQDQIPPRNFVDVKYQVSKALGPRLKFENVFSHFEEVPIAAASIAQVHRATLCRNNSSTEDVVAVKVQHVGIESVMKADLQALDWVTRIIAWSEPEYNFGPLMTEWRRQAILELDFCREHENVNIVASALNGNDDFHVWVPTTVDGVEPAKEMMVLQFAQNSVKVTEVEILRRYGVDLDVLMNNITEAFAHQMFHIGVFSGDPHPGNILVELPSDSNGNKARPVLLDFGLAKRLSDTMRLSFAKLVVASAEKDYFALLEAFDEMGLKLNRLDSEADMDAMRFLFRDTSPSTEARTQLRKFDKAMKNKAKARREKKIVKPVDAFPGDLLFFLRAQDLLRGLCSTLNVRQSPLRIFGLSSRKAIELALGSTHEIKLIKYLQKNSILSRPSFHSNANRALEAELQAVLSSLNNANKILGCQVAVFHNQVLAADVYTGLQENGASKKLRSVTPFSLFNCFSVTKAITVTAVHMLVDRGLLEYTQKVGFYWPEFGIKHPLITVGDVISHRARMQNALPENVTFQQFCNLKHMSEAMCSIDSEAFDPEQDDAKQMKYHYLSFGWLIAGLVQSVTGEPFKKFLLENILIPLNIEHEARIGVPSSWLRYDNINCSRFCKLDVSEMVPDGKAKGEDSFTMGVSAAEMDDVTRRLEKRVEELANFEDGSKSKEKGRKSMKDLMKLFKDKTFLYDVRCYNCRAVRQACIPASNGNFSARALATFFSKLYYTNTLIKNDSVKREMIAPVAYEIDRSGSDKAVKVDWAYGYKLFPFILPGKGKLNGFGHAGVGGSIAMCIPHANVTVAITINKLTLSPHSIWKPIFDVVDKFYGIGSAVGWGGDNAVSYGLE